MFSNDPWSDCLIITIIKLIIIMNRVSGDW